MNEKSTEQVHSDNNQNRKGFKIKPSYYNANSNSKSLEGCFVGNHGKQPVRRSGRQYDARGPLQFLPAYTFREDFRWCADFKVPCGFSSAHCRLWKLSTENPVLSVQDCQRTS